LGEVIKLEKMNKIEFKYLTTDKKQFKHFELPIEEYFDLDENEVPKIDSIPKHSQPFQYLDVSLSKLIFIKLIIQIQDEKKVLNQTFWNNGENFMTERVDVGKNNYRELIISTKVNGKTQEYETIRLYFSSEFIFPIHHGIISMNENGEETERKFDLTPFIEMINNM
jgi:hypothetical protein